MIAEFFRSYVSGLKEALDSIPAEKFEVLIRELESAHHDGRQIFMMGNGGSGATASHIACDFNKGVSLGLEKRLRVISLNDNVATMTAYANDVSYEDVFVEQLKNFLRPGDLVIGISGSGNSPNVLKAIDYANSAGAHTIGITGFSGGKMAKVVTTSLVVPVNDMQKAEDVHLILFHVAMQVLYARLRNQQELTGAPVC